jgi:hypothetical protein
MVVLRSVFLPNRTFSVYFYPQRRHASPTFRALLDYLRRMRRN